MGLLRRKGNADLTKDIAELDAAVRSGDLDRVSRAAKQMEANGHGAELDEITILFGTELLKRMNRR